MARSTQAERDAATSAGTMRLHVRDLEQLFNTIDPSPFTERDLDPTAEAYIVEWARDLPGSAPLALEIVVDRPAGPEAAEALTEAVQAHFTRSSEWAQRELRRLLRRGRLMLLIGLVFMVTTTLAGGSVYRNVESGSLAEVLATAFIILGWVAMWGPLEIFLYEWWPIVGDRRLYDRLARMPVRVIVAPERERLGASRG